MNKEQLIVKGVVVDPLNKTIEGGRIIITNGKITAIEHDSSIAQPFILPGFVDSHIHIESSMLIPSKFAKMALAHGTIAVVCDPHEVANVAGIDGINYMLNDAKQSPLKFFFGVPSCVPASPQEKSGAVINSKDVEDLLSKNDFLFLAEMMNFPGVIYDDPEVQKKINAAIKINKPVDGHAPGLSGEGLKKYIDKGITTDHECSTLLEAEEKIALGMKILIREGSAAKNFDNLIPLIENYPQSVMFCTDDCHPDYLEKGHINRMVDRAIGLGYNLFNVIKAASINPIKHYNLPLGMLQVNDSADFVIVEDLTHFKVLDTYIEGRSMVEELKTKNIIPETIKPRYAFREKPIVKEDLKVISSGNRINVIQAIDGDLITDWLIMETPAPAESEIIAQPENDLLKIVLLDRYSEEKPVVGFIKGFNLKQGAMAASIAHDSHHLISIGSNEQDIVDAVNWIVEHKGGICFTNRGETNGIPLNYFGLMGDADGMKMSADYSALNQLVKRSGCSLSAPFMTLSFMGLTVIPKLKINHNGLFDGINFKNVPLFFNF